MKLPQKSIAPLFVSMLKINFTDIFLVFTTYNIPLYYFFIVL